MQGVPLIPINNSGGGQMERNKKKVSVTYYAQNAFANQIFDITLIK